MCITIKISICSIARITLNSHILESMIIITPITKIVFRSKKILQYLNVWHSTNRTIYFTQQKNSYRRTRVVYKKVTVHPHSSPWRHPHRPPQNNPSKNDSPTSSTSPTTMIQTTSPTSSINSLEWPTTQKMSWPTCPALSWTAVT